MCASEYDTMYLQASLYIYLLNNKEYLRTSWIYGRWYKTFWVHKVRGVKISIKESLKRNECFVI